MQTLAQVRAPSGAPLVGDVSPCVERQISRDGMRVRLCAQQLANQEWILRIYGRGDQISEWMQCFDTALEAIAAGLNALHFEGIEAFYEDPLFRHLPP